SMPSPSSSCPTGVHGELVPVASKPTRPHAARTRSDTRTRRGYTSVSPRTMTVFARPATVAILRRDGRPRPRGDPTALRALRGVVVGADPLPARGAVDLPRPVSPVRPSDGLRVGRDRLVRT